MSRAFTKESDDSEWLGDVAPDIRALERYLTNESGGIRVTHTNHSFDAELGREVYEMSNGECYALDEESRWTIVH